MNEVIHLKNKLYKLIYQKSNKYQKKIVRKMSLYRKDWDRKVEVLGDRVLDKLNSEIEMVKGLSKKNFSMMFGKKPKKQYRKGRLKSKRYSQYKGGLPKDMKPKGCEDKHMVVSKKFVVKG